MPMPGANDLIARVGIDGVQDAKTDLSGLVGSFKDVASTIGLVSVALAGATAAFNMIQSGIKTASEFESLQMRLENLYGSAEKGAKVFDKFKNIATATPFTLQEVVNAGAQLKAFGMDAENTLTSVSDLASFMGLNVVEAANAVGRAFAGGAGAADILRERGVLNLIKSFKGIDDLTKLTLPEFREALISSMQDPAAGIAGAGERMMDTYEGALSNLEDAWSNLSANIGSKFLPTVDAATRVMTSFVNKLAGIDSAEKIAVAETKEMELQFKVLTGTYLRLSQQQNKNSWELEYYHKVIADMQKIYPEYFANLDLEKGKYEDIKFAIDQASQSLQQEMWVKVQSGRVEDLKNEYADTWKVFNETQEELENFNVWKSEFYDKFKDVPFMGDFFKSHDVQIQALGNRLQDLAEKGRNIEDSIMNITKDLPESNIVEPPEASPPDNSAAGAAHKKMLGDLISDLRDFQTKKYAMSLSGKDQELALLQLEWDAKKSIIMNGITNENELSIKQKSQLIQLNEMYGFKSSEIVSKYAEKEQAEKQRQYEEDVRASERRFEEILRAHEQFSQQMRSIDTEYYRDYLLQELDAEYDAYLKAGVNEVLLHKWVAEQKKAIDREVRQQQEANNAAVIDEWRENNEVIAGVFDAIGQTLEENMSRVLMITSNTKNVLERFMVDLANNIISELQRILMKQLAVAFWMSLIKAITGGLGGSAAMFGGSGVDTIPVVPMASYTGQGFGSATIISGPMETMLINLPTLINKIDKLTDAIEENPARIYTQTIKGIPLRDAVETAQRQTNAL